MQDNHDRQVFNSWQERQHYAENMVPLLGKLHRENGIDVTIYGRSIYGSSVIDIIKAHRMVRQHTGSKLPLRESWAVLKELSELALQNMQIDIGKLAVSYQTVEPKGTSLSDFVADQVAQFISADNEIPSSDVVLYGFGRIGRLLARLLIEQQGQKNALRLRAIVVRGGKDGDLEKRASLLRRDSVHGPFNGSVTIDKEHNAIIANGAYIQVIYANSPSEIDYTEYGIDNAVVIDNTGMWRDEQGLSQHVNCQGVNKVLLTAPGKGEIKNIVHGVNHGDISIDDRILSAASCTTNAITPVLKVLDEAYGIVDGHVETVHSFTNDQNLIDNFHKADRRGRSASLNMVITETGAAQAVAKAYPQLAGKLTGNAIRVPTPNVSLAILSLNINAQVTADELNNHLREMSLYSSLSQQIDYTASTEVVSSDFVGTRYASVIDSQATITSGQRVTLYVWYDNEFGYSCQVMRVLEEMMGAKRPSVPAKNAE
jgi:glyceraldehyde 3-phosphate dehydrogenase